MLANKVSRFFIALGLTLGTFLFIALLDKYDWLFVYIVGFAIFSFITFMYYKILEPINDGDD